MDQVCISIKRVRRRKGDFLHFRLIKFKLPFKKSETVVLGIVHLKSTTIMSAREVRSNRWKMNRSGSVVLKDTIGEGEKERIIMSSCGTKPMSFFRWDMSGNSAPFSFTLPEVLAALPVRREMMVAPLGPMMAHKRPGLKEPFTFFMIVLPLGRGEGNVSSLLHRHFQHIYLV